jgi:hypothetical protein
MSYATRIFTGGSNSEHGVSARIAVFIESKLADQLTYTLDKKCCKSEAEQLAIVKDLLTPWSRVLPEKLKRPELLK